MGCSFSGLNALVGGGSGDIWINEKRFKILRQLIGSDNDNAINANNAPVGVVYLVKEEEMLIQSNASAPPPKDHPSHVSEDGTYAIKKLLITKSEQLELVREEIRISSLFNHPNLLPLLDHAIIPLQNNNKTTQEASPSHEAYLLFPLHLDGTLLDHAKAMKPKQQFFSTSDVLIIFRQLCAGLSHMHNLDPPYAHNDVKPGNVILTRRKGKPPLAILMDFANAGPARKQIRSPSESLQLQEWASEKCTPGFRAPEFWDCLPHAEIDERSDIWSLGCTLYAIMYGGISPFEYADGESEGSLQLAVANAQIKWPTEGPSPPYPDGLHQFVRWMVQPQATLRPRIDDIIIHVDKLISKFSSS